MRDEHPTASRFGNRRFVTRSGKHPIAIGAVYFGLVFGAGFALGTVRVLWAAPHFGVRTAELAETPVMVLAMVAASRWSVRRLAPPRTPGRRLAIGLVGLGLLLAAEFGVVLRLRGLTLAEYAATRDPVSGVVYLAALGAFAALPLVVARDRG